MGITGSNDRRKHAAAGNVSRGKPLRFTIPSDFSAWRDVQEKILQELVRNGFKDESLFAVKLSLEEALVNAIKHGNKLNPNKQVRIEARLTPQRASILIEDEGAGFERCGVPDPTLEENLQKCSGRGILLIEAYMDSVKYSEGGRCVRMVKKNTQ
jgi:serine/threonine-protein kinase RsbW